MLKLAAPTLTAFALTSATSCTPAPTPNPTPSEPIERVERLLDESDNALRVALRKSLTDYFIYRGRPRGFEYDLLSRFAKTLDRRISVRVVTDDEQLEYLIERGEIDLWVPAEPWGGIRDGTPGRAMRTATRCWSTGARAQPGRSMYGQAQAPYATSSAGVRRPADNRSLQRTPTGRCCNRWRKRHAIRGSPWRSIDATPRHLLPSMVGS